LGRLSGRLKCFRPGRAEQLPAVGDAFCQPVYAARWIERWNRADDRAIRGGQPWHAISQAGATLHGANLLAITAASLDPDPPQQVQGVFKKYAWQAYAGYTFFRFYETSHPTNRETQNGGNWSIVYYWKDWFGIDGEMSATYGHQSNHDSWFLFGGGGPRFRWSGPRGAELWGHALFGRSHFTPQTAFGPQEAFAYELGGGVDIGGHYKRWAIRVSGDVIGSHYFSTYQFSPKISTGFVFKF
jgi:hypothetical protein